MPNLAIFVNSSDGFADCWTPFFTLFRRYGDTLRELPLYVNTERASCVDPTLDITSTHTWPVDEKERPTWSQCLLRGLERVEEPFILYLQEDYFLTRDVIGSRISDALELLKKNPDAPVVYLNRYGPQFENASSLPGGFVEIHKPVRYLLSTQAAIWRKSSLMELVAPWENGWMFEKFGSLRAARSHKQHFSLAKPIMEHDPVIEYIYTGVIKGRWKRECVDLFSDHGIEVDFSKRGFYEDRGRLKSRIEVIQKLVADPRNTFRSIGTLL